MNVSDYLVKRLADWGVQRVFGYPGDGINGIMGAFNRNDHGVRFIQARHEEMAAFMACGHAKFTGSVGVCLATSGPGAVHLLNGLYDAKMDHAPVVAIVGQAARTAIGGDYQQEVDLPNLFKDVAKAYVQTVMTPESARHVVDRAFRIAQADRTVTCVIVPKDVQELSAAEPRHAHDTVHTGIGFPRPVVTPSEPEIARAADLLNTAQRVAILVGAGAAGALDEVIAAGEALGAGIAKALLGRAVVPDDLPYCTGAIGLLGTRASWNLLNECDALLVVGSSFPYAEFLPREGQARGVQIDIDPGLIGIRFPMEVNLVGDAKATLGLLLARLHPKSDRTWQSRVMGWRHEWDELSRERAALPAKPINPQRVFTELSERLPDGAIVTSDSGSCANWFARDLVLRTGMMASLSGSLATMGPGVPYAIAAKFAYPDRPVLALVGDGAMQMNGNAELITIAKYYREWRDPRLVVLVLHNDDLNQVTWEMRAMESDPSYLACQSLPSFRYADYAQLVGLRGFRVDDPTGLGAAWEHALSADRPAVLEVITDPDVPPLPPHITLEQAKAFGLSMLKGDAREGGVLRQALAHVLPGAGAKLSK
jgi:pyruvate dehydrogenase (quinone)